MLHGWMKQAVMALSLLSSCTARAPAQLPDAQVPATASLPATQPARPLFDPHRHMRVSEVRPGMKGHGLSVFSGTKIERFEVEVVSVLKNFNTAYDVVLVRCAGANLEHTGAIEAMSGSPIFLRDDQGRERMIGAFAYGWTLAKDPIAGVQPIEYMLELPGAPAVKPPTRATASSWPMPAAAETALSSPFRLATATRETDPLNPDGPATALRPLATPLMLSGISLNTMEAFAPLLKARGLVPLQAGSASAPADAAPPAIEPGAVLAAPLLIGDMDITAIGTVTEVIDDQVLGFGHSFNNEGDISLPMGSGMVHTVVANYISSFKLGSMIQPSGTLNKDQTVGVAGVLGPAPAMIPIEIRVIYEDGSVDQTYRMQAAVHPQLTSLLATLGAYSALTGRRDLPPHHTLNYAFKLSFEGGHTIESSNRVVNASAGLFFRQVGLPIQTAFENPFAATPVTAISGELRVASAVRQAEILSVQLPRETYKPGETVKAFVNLRPYQQPEEILAVELPLPADLADGDYQIHISDYRNFLMQEQATRPFRFMAESIDEVFAVLQEVASIKSSALYLRLVRQPDGIAVGRAALPRMPESRRQLLIDAGRSNVTPFVSSSVVVVPTDRIMQGTAEFSIRVESETRIAVGEAPSRAADPKQEPGKGKAEHAAPAKTHEDTQGPQASDPE